MKYSEVIIVSFKVGSIVITAIVIKLLLTIALPTTIISSLAITIIAS